MITMNRNEAIAYLTRCADDNGDHWHGGRKYTLEDCPTCKGTNVHDARVDNRYGTWTSQAAVVAYRHAKWWARELGEELDYRILSDSMSLVVNGNADIETDLQGYATELSGANIDSMVSGYLEAQLWAGLDYGHDKCHEGDPCDDDRDHPEPHPWGDHYSRDDIAPEYVDKVRDEFAALVYAHPLAVRMYLEYREWYHTGEDGVILRKRRTEPKFDSSHFGHDFYLTREGHGAGFWDRGLGELGDYLTQISKWAGSADDLWDSGNGVLK